MNTLNCKLSSHYKLKIIDSWAKHATHPFFPLLSLLAHSYTSRMINLLSCDGNFPTPMFCFAMVSQISFSNNSVCCRHRGKKSSTWALVWFRIWMSSGSGYQKGTRITGGCCSMGWCGMVVSWSPGAHWPPPLLLSLYNAFMWNASTVHYNMSSYEEERYVIIYGTSLII